MDGQTADEQELRVELARLKKQATENTRIIGLMKEAGMPIDELVRAADRYGQRMREIIFALRQLAILKLAVQPKVAGHICQATFLQKPLDRPDYARRDKKTRP